MQALEQQAAALKTDLEAEDAKRREIEAPANAAQAELTALEQTVEDRMAARRAGERDIAATQQRLEKFRAQLMAVTNSREYEAAQHEVATAEAELRKREDETLALLMELDELAPRVEAARAALARARDDVGVALAGLSDHTRRYRLDLANVEGSIAALRAAIDARALALYDRVSKRHPHQVLAELRGDTCAGCHVRLRPMLATEVRRGESIVQCESCTRLLYFQKSQAPPSA